MILPYTTVLPLLRGADGVGAQRDVVQDGAHDEEREHAARDGSEALLDVQRHLVVVGGAGARVELAGKVDGHHVQVASLLRNLLIRNLGTGSVTS